MPTSKTYLEISGRDGPRPSISDDDDLDRAPPTAPSDPPTVPSSRPPCDERCSDLEPPTRRLRPRPFPRTSSAPLAEPSSHSHDLVVYTIGKGFRPTQVQDLEERLASLHQNPAIRDLCTNISAAADLFLTLAHTASKGWGYVAKREIPARSDVCYYTGVIRLKRQETSSNHCIDLGDIFGSPLVVDGCPLHPSSARTGSMQLVNHACRVDVPSGAQGPNCQARHVVTEDGLGLWVLQTSRVIREGEALSFDYGGSFWSSGEHGVSEPGRTLVLCRCAGTSCPRGRWRLEKQSRNMAPRSQEEALPSRTQSTLNSWLTRGAASPSENSDGEDGGAVHDVVKPDNIVSREPAFPPCASRVFDPLPDSPPPRRPGSCRVGTAIDIRNAGVEIGPSHGVSRVSDLPHQNEAPPLSEPSLNARHSRNDGTFQPSSALALCATRTADTCARSAPGACRAVTANDVEKEEMDAYPPPYASRVSSPLHRIEGPSGLKPSPHAEGGPSSPLLGASVRMDIDGRQEDPHARHQILDDPPDYGSGSFDAQHSTELPEEAFADQILRASPRPVPASTNLVSPDAGPPPALDSPDLPPQRVLSLNVGPVGLRESLPFLAPLFTGTPAVVFIQEAKVPPRAVRGLKKLAHSLLPHYSLFVGRLPDDGSGAVRHEVVTFVHSHLAARASLLEVSRQAYDVDNVSRGELLSRTHFVRTTDVHSRVTVVWTNIYGFQAKDVAKQEAQWAFVSAVLGRWQSQTDHIIIGGDFNASLLPRSGYRPDSVVHIADAVIRRNVEDLSLTMCAPPSATWTNSTGSKESVLDFFLTKSVPQGAPPLTSASAFDSPDPRHDHRAITSELIRGIISPLPPLDDLRAPVRLRMGAFRDKREQWADLVEERVRAIPDLEQLGALAKLDRIKEEASMAAREVLGTTGGKLRQAIRFHSRESIRLLSLLRTVKAARRDILSRKIQVSPGHRVGPSKAMREMWDRGHVPQGGSFAMLTDPFSPPHATFTAEWLAHLRQTADQILTDLKALRDSERKQAEAQSRADAVIRMYQGRGELRRFLHGSDPRTPAPFLKSPLPDSLTVSCENVDPRIFMSSIRSIDDRLGVSFSHGKISVESIPPSVLHRVLSTPGIAPGITWASHANLVSATEDRLSCWEFKLAQDGLATHSRCSTCLQHSLLPVPYVEASSREISFFCSVCSTFRDLLVDPDDYKQIDFLEGAQVPKVPPGAPERLALPISREDLDWYLSTLPSYKAPGPDGLPYECLKYGPACVREAVFEAVNAVLTGQDLIPLSWKGGLIRYLYKKGDVADMGSYRPVCLQDSVYKVLSAVLTDRLYRIAEKYGLLADSQEGFRRLRSTTRQAQSLQWAFEDAAREKCTLYVAYLDFENAFNSTDHEALWQWLEHIGIPDVDLLRSLYRDAYYTADLPYGSTARIRLTRGNKQGDLISPLLFGLLDNVYLLALEATAGGVVRFGHKPQVARGFADDIAITATSKSQLQGRLSKTSQFCGWSGMRIKVIKSVLTAYDFAQRQDADVSGITYDGQPLRHLPATEAFTYLGIRTALAGCFRAERDHVINSVRELRDLVEHHRYNLDQMVEAMQMVASSRFRYSAPLVPWSDAQLDELYVHWIGLSKSAWRLPKSFPAAPLMFPPSQGGCPVPHPRVYLVQALATHVEQLVALPDHLRDRTIRQYKKLCVDTGCHTALELADFLSKERQPRPCPIARLLRVCGQLDITVKLPACLSLGPGEHETSWHRLFTCLRESARADPADGDSPRDFETVKKKWPAIRSSLRDKGLTEPRSLILDARAERPQWRLQALMDPWLRPLCRLLQRIPFEARRRLFPPLDRGRRPVVQEDHKDLISKTLKALNAPAEQAPIFRGVGAADHFRDPRWSRVQCRELSLTWDRLLVRYDLKGALALSEAELGADPALIGCTGIVRDLCVLGLSGRAPRRTLAELLTSVASSFTSRANPAAPSDAHHPLRLDQPCLSRDFVSISSEEPPTLVVEAPPFRITTRHGRCRVDRVSPDAGSPTHLGTVAQSRFSRLCNLVGQDRVLQSLSSWIQQAERSERTKGVASAQFWRGLRSSLGALGYIGGPALLLPPFFELTIPADDDRIKDPLPSGLHRPRAGRYVVDLLHKDATLQDRIRVLLANPGRMVFFVVTRPNTLEPDTAAMLARRFLELHTFEKGSMVVARKGNWSRGAFDAIQSREAWTVWAPRGLDEVDQAQMRDFLSAVVFSRDGVVPFDPACPSAREAKLGAQGSLYDRSGVLAATDGSVKKDGTMGAGVCWSRPDLAPCSFEVHGPPKSIVPELAALAAALARAPADEDLTILTDSKSALQMLRGMQRRDFPVFLHRRVEHRLLQRTVDALNARAAAGRYTHLVKVKAHSGEPLNTMADLLACTAAGQDPTQNFMDPLTVYFHLHDRPVSWGPRLRKHLCVVAASKRYESFREKKVSRDMASEESDSAHHTDTQLMNWTENWLSREGTGRLVLGKVLHQLEIGQDKRRILQTIAGKFPGQALLHQWGRADSARCLLCNAQSESQCHIQCLCPRLERARTAAHHQIARCLWSEITQRHRGARDDFTLVPETQVSDIRDLAPMRCSSTWDQFWARFFDPVGAPPDPPLADLGRLRPDAVAIRWDKRCMYLLEVTRAYDSRANFAERSDSFKTTRYQAVVDRFKAVAPLWHAVVIPFTVGVRGSFDEHTWAQHLATLEIPRGAIPRLMERIVDATLSALNTVFDARSSALREAPPPE